MPTMKIVLSHFEVVEALENYIRERYGVDATTGDLNHCLSVDTSHYDLTGDVRITMETGLKASPPQQFEEWVVQRKDRLNQVWGDWLSFSSCAAGLEEKSKIEKDSPGEYQVVYRTEKVVKE